MFKPILFNQTVHFFLILNNLVKPGRLFSEPVQRKIKNFL